MKQFLRGALIFVAIMGFGTAGLSMASAKHLAPAKTGSGGEKIATSADLASLSLATAVVSPVKINPNQTWDKSALRNDRENVEVLSRSYTFPEVLNQGNGLINAEYPNATTLCLDVALYVGRVEGLILAMDRDTVVQHRLFWTIDAADDLYYACLANLLRQAFADKNGNYRNQLKDVKEELAERIQVIQKILRYAQTVEMIADESHFCVPFPGARNN
jgi:hypothetical protein